jgi:hypothetical protein
MEYSFTSREWKNLTAAQRTRRCRRMAEEARALAEGASPDLKLAYNRVAESWMKLADDIRVTSTDPPSNVEPGRPKMKAADAQAIAEFLNGGGRIAKVKNAVSATEQEVIDFLATCGIGVKNFRGDMRSYSCNGRAYSMSALVRLANEYRRAQKLAPFAMRLVPWARKK